METIREQSGHVLANVLSQNAIDERLVSHVSALSFFPETDEHFWVQANRDEAPVPLAERWPTHTSHHSQLFARCLGNLREINWPSSDGTPLALCGSRASR